jgi:hypothetical protein
MLLLCPFAVVAKAVPPVKSYRIGKAGRRISKFP